MGWPVLQNNSNIDASLSTLLPLLPIPRAEAMLVLGHIDAFAAKVDAFHFIFSLFCRPDLAESSELTSRGRKPQNRAGSNAVMPG